MLSGAENFRSSLLVNSVLAVSCYCSATLPYRNKFWDTQTLGNRYFEDAKRLWELEKSTTPLLRTPQAAIMMGNLLNMCSLDKLGRKYNVQTLAMANELDLFVPLAQQTSLRQRDSYAFTAWSLLFSTCIQDYHTLQPPLCETCSQKPLPDSEEDPAWYGSFWLIYPLANAPVLVQHGLLFKAKMELAVIMNSISAAFFYRKEETEVNRRTQLRLASRSVETLTTWRSSLPVSLSPERTVFPSQLKLQLLYHNFMTHISGLLAKVNDDTTGNPIVTVDTQITNSNLCFETLMRLYYLRHGFEGCDAYLTDNLAVLAFTTLNSVKSAVSSLSTTEIDGIRGMLLLTAKELDGQGENYHLTRTIFHIRADMMPKGESITTRTTSVRLEDGLDTDLRMEYIQVQSPINITNIAESPDNMRLSNIIEKKKWN